MPKRQPVMLCNDKYKQTDITTYFKVRSKGMDDPEQLRKTRSKVCKVTRMTTKRKICFTSSNNECDSDGPVVSPAKKPKPIVYDDEYDSEECKEFSQSMIVPFETPKSLQKGKLSQYRPRTRRARPFPLPSYRCSVDTDLQYGSDSILSKTKWSNVRVQHKRRRLKLLELVPSDKSVEIEPIFLSDGEDFAEISPQLKKVAFSPDKNKSSVNKTSGRVQEKLVKSRVEPPKSKRRLGNQWQKDKQKFEVESSTILSKVSSIKPSKTTTTTKKISEVSFTQAFPSTTQQLLKISSTSISTTPEKMVKFSLTVHRPARIVTARDKQKPNILKRKSYSDSNLPSKHMEYISTDFLANSTLQIPFSSKSSRKATILEDITISSPVTQTLVSLEQISLSANKPETDSTTGTNNILSSTLQSCNTSSNSIQSSPHRSLSKESFVMKNKENESMLNLTAQRVDDNNGDDSSWNPIAFHLFKRITQYVGSHTHLKTMLYGEDSELLNRFFNLPNKQYMFVCLKLFTRIHKWYNIIKLADVLKLEMSPAKVKDMYKCLSENGFVDCDFSSDPTIELLNLLLRKELLELCQSFKIKLYNEASKTKPNLIKKLLMHCNSQSTLTFAKTIEDILKDRIKQKMGICIRLNSMLLNVFNKIHFLYSFVTDDFETTSDMYLFLSKIHYKDMFMPQIRVDDHVQIFSSIDEFSKFSEAHECKRAVEDAFTKKDVKLMTEICELAYSKLQEILASPSATRPSHLKRFTVGHQYTRALSIGVKHLAQHEPRKVEHWLTFLIKQKQYCLRAHGSWYDLLVMVQSRYLKQHDIAVETMVEALKQDYLSEIDRHNLSYRAEAIKNRRTNKISELQKNRLCFEQPVALEEPSFIEITARAASSFKSDTAPGQKLKFVRKTANGQSVTSVEETALQHYFDQGFTNGLHCEGSLLTTIFFVLFWDIIYESYVPAVFITEIQYYPLDLHSPEFYINRKAAIDKRLDEIKFSWSFDQLKAFICDTWHKHAHEKSYISDRLVDDPTRLYDIILCIGRVTLGRCLERIVSDFQAYHSGLPDLFLWNVSKKTCKFVEVKSEKDRLSTKQKLWLNFLNLTGAHVEVCYVRNTGSKPSVRGRKIKE